MLADARGMLDAGRAADALAATTRALEAAPKDGAQLALHAEALLTLEAWHEALGATERLLQVDPDSVWARRMKCVALENLHRFEAAIEVARDAIARAPDEANAHFMLAKNLWQTSHDQEAIVALERAIAIEPDVPRYRVELANFVFVTDRARAESLLERIVTDEPAKAGALNDLGVLLELRGDVLRAAALYRRATRANPASKVAERNRVRLARGEAAGMAAFLGVVACAAPAAVGAWLTSRGYHGAGTFAVTIALVGMLLSVLVGLQVSRRRRALREKGPERSDA